MLLDQAYHLSVIQQHILPCHLSLIQEHILPYHLYVIQQHILPYHFYVIQLSKEKLGSSPSCMSRPSNF